MVISNKSHGVHDASLKSDLVTRVNGSAHFGNLGFGFIYGVLVHSGCGVVMEGINNKVLFIKFGILLESTTRNLEHFVTGLLEVSEVTGNDGSDTTRNQGSTLEGINKVILGLEHIFEVLGLIVPVFGYLRGLGGHGGKGVKASSEVVVVLGPFLNFFLVVSDVVLQNRSGDTIAEGDAAGTAEDGGNTATIDLGSLRVSPVSEFLRFTFSGLSEFFGTVTKVFVHLHHAGGSLVHLELDGLGIGEAGFDGVVQQ